MHQALKAHNKIAQAAAKQGLGHNTHHNTQPCKGVTVQRKCVHRPQAKLNQIALDLGILELGILERPTPTGQLNPTCIGFGIWNLE
jgi:hypothetical protein